MEAALPGVRAQLDRRLSALSKVIAQVVKDPAAAPPSAAGQLDLELQALLRESAQRIADFQRDIDYKQQAFDLSAVLQAAKDEHAAQRAALEQALAAAEAEVGQLRGRVTELEAGHGVLAQQAEEAQQQALAAEAALAEARQEQGGAVQALRQQVEGLQARERELMAQCEEEASRHNAEVQQLRGALDAEQAAAERRQEEHGVAAATWQRERQGLLDSHGTEVQALTTQLDQLQGEAAAVSAGLAEAGQRAADAEQRAEQGAAAAAQAAEQAQRLRGDLEAAGQQQAELQGELAAAQQAAASLTQQLQQAEHERATLAEESTSLSTQLRQEAERLRAAQEALAVAQAQHGGDRELWERRAAEDKAVLDAKDGQLAALQGELAGAEQQLQQGAEKLAAAESRAAELSAQLDNVQSELERCRQQAVADTDAAGAERDVLQARCAVLEDELAGAKEALAQAGCELDEVRSRLEGELQAVQAAHAAAVVRAEEEHRTQLSSAEQALSSRLQQQEAAAAEALARLEADHAQELAALRARHAHSLQCQLARFDQHCAGLSGAMERMAELLHMGPEVALSAADAPSPIYVPPPGDDLGDAGIEGEGGSGASDGSGAGPTATAPGGATGGQPSCSTTISYEGSNGRPASGNGDSPFTQLLAAAPPLPLPLTLAHAVLQQLYSAAVDLRAQRGALLTQVAELQADAERAQRHLELEQVRWEWQLADQGRDRDQEWGQKLEGAVAAEQARWQERLAAMEGALRAELQQTAEALAGAKEECVRLLRRCAEYEEVIAELKRQHAESAAAAAAAAADELSALRTQHAQQLGEALAGAGREKERVEALLRDELRRTLQAQQEKHNGALEGLRSNHGAALAEVAVAAEQARQQHQQELAAADKSWAAKLEGAQQQHAEDAARQQSAHLEAVAALQQQHAEASAALQARITLLERSERQLLTAKAVLEGQAGKLEASIAELRARLEELAQDHRADLAQAQQHAQQAVEAVQEEMQRRLEAAAGERADLEQRAAQLQERLGREPRPQDLQRIAALEAGLAEAQAAVAAAEARYQRMRQEMLLREDNYNRTFANGGAGLRSLGVERALGAQQGMVEWMLNNSKGGAGSKGLKVPAAGDSGAVGGGRHSGGGSRGGTASPPPLLPHLKGGRR